MQVLSVKKERLEELTNFGFTKEKDSYIYKGNRLNYDYLIQVSSVIPTLSISEYDMDDFENSTVIGIPDIVMELIKAGMVENYQDWVVVT